MRRLQQVWRLSWLVLCCAASVVSVVSVGCQGEHSSAQCNACSRVPFTEADCARFSFDAGCKSWELLSADDVDSSSCSNACYFRDCEDVPVCEDTSPSPDEDGAVDAAAESSTPDASSGPSADACEGADGKFDDCDLCNGECGMTNINGAIFFTCQCGEPCPCGLTCGSIPLSVGGTLGNVCAP